MEDSFLLASLDDESVLKIVLSFRSHIACGKLMASRDPIINTPDLSFLMKLGEFLNLLSRIFFLRSVEVFKSLLGREPTKADSQPLSPSETVGELAPR